MNRRTLLTRIVGGFSAVALFGFSFPFLRSWFPGFSDEHFLDVDIAELNPGEVKQIRWLGRNVLLIRREDLILDQLDKTDAATLEDAASMSPQQPQYAQNQYRSRKPEHLLVYANCTHLGCEVQSRFSGTFEGFDCPCHFSRFDAAGRVEKGSAAKLNLEVPDYEYIGQEVIRLRQVNDTA